MALPAMLGSLGSMDEQVDQQGPLPAAFRKGDFEAAQGGLEVVMTEVHRRLVEGYFHDNVGINIGLKRTSGRLSANLKLYLLKYQGFQRTPMDLRSWDNRWSIGETIRSVSVETS